MPRKGYGSKVGRGGPRTSPAGQAHANRTDMQGTQPIRTAPGQPYGSAKQQEMAQQVVPLPSTDGNGVASTVPAPTPAPLPGSLTPLSAPTARADEPITAGIDAGAGPGSEALLTAPRQYGARVLDHLAASTGDPFLTAMAERARGQVI